MTKVTGYLLDMTSVILSDMAIFNHGRGGQS